MSSFIQSMSNNHKNTTVGENGSKMYSIYGIDTTSQIKSAFLAAFNGIMENTDNRTLLPARSAPERFVTHAPAKCGRFEKAGSDWLKLLLPRSKAFDFGLL